MNRRILRITVALAAACTVLAGCASAQSPVDLAKMNQVKNPIPQLVGKAALPADPGDDHSCGNPEASPRPGSMPPPGSMPSGTTMAKIVKRGVLIAGVDQNTYLFGFRDPGTGDLEGFDIDVVHDIAAALFGDPNKVRFKVINSAQRVPALQHGDVDIVVRTMTVNCQRRKDVGFSSVYYRAKQRLLVPSTSPVTGLSGLGGQRVCAATGSTSLITIYKTPTKPIPVAVDDWSDCLVLLQQGDVAGISTDDSILAGMAAQDPNTKIVGPSQADEPYAVAVPKQNTDMERFVNGVLDQIRGDNQWRASYAKWIGDKLGPIPDPPAPTYSGPPSEEG